MSTYGLTTTGSVVMIWEPLKSALLIMTGNDLGLAVLVASVISVGCYS
jgi:hypothetical protein